jgi:hypothetical protein
MGAVRRVQLAARAMTTAVDDACVVGVLLSHALLQLPQVCDVPHEEALHALSKILLQCLQRQNR